MKRTTTAALVLAAGSLATTVNGWLNLAGAALAVALVVYELKGRDVSRVRA